MRWTMLLILFLVRLAMGFQFQSVASTSAQLIDAFGLSYAQVGTLIGLFLLPGVFIAIPSGALTRAISDKNLLMLGAVTMTVGAGTADGGRRRLCRAAARAASQMGDRRTGIRGFGGSRLMEPTDSWHCRRTTGSRVVD